MAHPSARVVLAVLVAGAALLGPLAGAPPTDAVERSSPSTMSRAEASWHIQSSGTKQALYGVACFDAFRCKAVGAGGTLLDTKNGGKTWRTQRNPLDGSSTVLYRIACPAPSTCYVIGRPNIILVTHNGGASWSLHRIALPGLGPALTDATCVGWQAAPLRGRPALCRLGLLDVACTNARTCLVVATVKVRARIGDLGPAVFLTTDAGATWTKQRIPTTTPCWGDCTPSNARLPYPLEWISCGPDSRCRAGGSTFLGSHPGWGTLIIGAENPGAPWAPLKQYDNSGYGPAPDSAVCPTVTRCYGVWTTSPFQPGNEIWLSSDGGWTWQGTSSGSSRLRNGIACPGATTCYSVGNRGTITASINGRPFAAQLSATRQDLYGVTCVGELTCFAVGNKGTIEASAHRQRM